LGQLNYLASACIKRGFRFAAEEVQPPCSADDRGSFTVLLWLTRQPSIVCQWRTGMRFVWERDGQRWKKQKGVNGVKLSRMSETDVTGTERVDSALLGRVEGDQHGNTPLQAPAQSEVQCRRLLGNLCGTFHRISTWPSDTGGEPGTGAEVGGEAECRHG
jgi:hypothetical protein